MGHIALSRGADSIVVAPASADFLAKLAHGHADDLLSTLCLARECPLFVAPAMNRQMWANAATQRNVAQLAADGVHVLGPDTGELACKENGEGRMLEAADLFALLVASKQPKVLAGKRVLLTAGPTFEAIDPVRGITNSSSGKMGFALAQAAAEAGARSHRRRGPSAVPTPPGVTRVSRRSAAQMARRRARARRRCDVFIGVAAVADYTPATSARAEAQEVRGRIDDHAEADRRHPRDRRRARQAAVLRRLRGGESRRRAAGRGKAQAQEAAAAGRQPRAGCAGRRRQRGHAARRCRRASAAAHGQAGAGAAAGERDRRQGLPRCRCDRRTGARRSR